jgi:lipopolysaccharide export system permease protein
MINFVTKLDKYILQNLLGPFVFFSLVLTFVVWLTQSLRLVDLIVNKGLSMGFFLTLTSLVLPGVISIILPIAVVAAVLYCFQRLNSDSELVVMWSAGVGNLRLARSCLVFAGAATAVAFLLSLYFVPGANRAFKELQVELRSNIAYLPLQEGAFNTVTKGLTIYIRARKSNGDLLGILVHDNRDIDNPITMMAESGALVRTEGSPQFLLLNGNRQQLDRQTKKLSMLHFDAYNLDLSQFVERKNARWLKPKERFLHELLWIDENEANDVESRGRLWATGHDQLTNPLFALAFTLIALTIMLTGEFNRRERGRRLIVAIVLVMAVRLLGLAFVNMTAQSILLTPLIYLNVLTPIAISLYLLAHQKRNAGRIMSFVFGGH